MHTVQIYCITLDAEQYDNIRFWSISLRRQRNSRMVARQQKGPSLCPHIFRNNEELLGSSPDRCSGSHKQRILGCAAIAGKRSSANRIADDVASDPAQRVKQIHRGRFGRT